MTKYEELRDEIVKVVPNCSGDWVGNQRDPHFEVNPSLADVLRWTHELYDKERSDVFVAINCYGNAYEVDTGAELGMTLFKWDLTKDLEGQSEDVIDFLLSLSNK